MRSFSGGFLIGLGLCLLLVTAVPLYIFTVMEAIRNPAHPLSQTAKEFSVTLKAYPHLYSLVKWFYNVSIAIYTSILAVEGAPEYLMCGALAGVALMIMGIIETSKAEARARREVRARRRGEEGEAKEGENHNIF